MKKVFPSIQFDPRQRRQHSVHKYHLARCLWREESWMLRGRLVYVDQAPVVSAAGSATDCSIAHNTGSPVRPGRPCGEWNCVNRHGDTEERLGLSGGRSSALLRKEQTTDGSVLSQHFGRYGMKQNIYWHTRTLPLSLLQVQATSMQTPPPSRCRRSSPPPVRWQHRHAVSVQQSWVLQCPVHCVLSDAHTVTLRMWPSSPARYLPGLSCSHWQRKWKLWNSLIYLPYRQSVLTVWLALPFHYIVFITLSPTTFTPYYYPFLNWNVRLKFYQQFFYKKAHLTGRFSLIFKTDICWL